METSAAQAGITTISTPTDQQIRVTRIFDAPRERVWRAFTDPELLAQWWGRGRTTVVERMDVNRGGRWRFVVQALHGAQGFEGRYREVTPEERLVTTFEWDGLPGFVTVETTIFEDLGDGRTRLVNLSQFFTKSERDAALAGPMEAGLNESYAALDRLLATPS